MPATSWRVPGLKVSLQKTYEQNYILRHSRKCIRSLYNKLTTFYHLVQFSKKEVRPKPQHMKGVTKNEKYLLKKDVKFKWGSQGLL